ncbi:putative 3-(3-hydroxy-phenyl) propionate hydroxylase [Mycobacterium marinum]|uniref:bifunctional 3-(3-hydroxy-phenyl)propionate/3-hydroxycinnamic acid hydroxylase MhpA n=1 Tax=Mycobacterium marinum TaxID=1781 RepID=UPI0021C4C58D|nr:bifunctional 3-(3-hydroxy-phenyl)propionate/3-hydroxycinnamic acid hydroxylase [Mycobacterium marinum]GJO47254.1 putative 3-(3-hydroxy-phenyl) propionate hydroxylase [Mycobacterium marinum]
MSDKPFQTIRQVPVVIVGAGPTGITAATLLAQHGVESMVLERWTDVYPQPRAVHLDDEIYRVIARLGIADEFAAISRPTQGLRLLDNRFNVLTEFHRDPARSLHGFPQANMFDQPELETLLRANLKRYAHAQLRGGAEVIEICDTNELLRVTFTDRSDGRVHHVDAEYVLGCDGANSMVRSHIGSTMADLNFQQRWLVVDVATECDLAQWDGVYQVCDPFRAATYMRIGQSRYRWEFQLRPGERTEDFNSISALHPLIAPWTTDIAEGDLTLLRVAEYTFRAQIADQWRRGNIFILGDAAHLTPPFIGQGMGAGLRDAMNLSWKIAAVRCGTLTADALDTYQQERKPHTRQLIRLALAIGQFMTGGGRLGNVVRRALLPRVRFVPGLRDKISDSTTPALHASALVHKTHRFGRSRQLAGSLCPNPLLPEGQRLDAVIGTRFAVITSTPLGEAQELLLRRRNVLVLVTPPASSLADWLRRGGVKAALVRPDRTVMRAARDTVALCSWADRALPAS